VGKPTQGKTPTSASSSSASSAKQPPPPSSSTLRRTPSASSSSAALAAPIVPRLRVEFGAFGASVWALAFDVEARRAADRRLTTDLMAVVANERDATVCEGQRNCGCNVDVNMSLQTHIEIGVNIVFLYWVMPLFPMSRIVSLFASATH
jgi:hypothetical protein